MNNPNIAATQQVKPADGEALIWACDQRDPRTIGPMLLNDARNLRYAEGLPATRKGVVKPAWANFTSSGPVMPIPAIGSLGGPFGAGVFRDPNGVEWQIVAAGGYVWRTRPGNANVTVPLPTGVRIVSPCRFVQAFNLLFCFRGRYLAPLVMSDLDTGFTDLIQQYAPGTVYQAAVVASGQAADEIAYGPYLQVSSLTWSNGRATCVTVLPHGYVTGTDVTITGAVPSAYNGRVGITVVDAYTFTYALQGVASSPATGTITVSNNAYYWTAAGSQVTLSSLTRATNSKFTLSSLTAPKQVAVTALTCAQSMTVTSLTRVGTTATAVCANHGLIAGASVTILGSNQPLYNGTFTVTTAKASTFQYTMTGTPGTSPATGVITAHASYTQLATATAAGHGLATGATVTIAGASPAAYNGTFVVTVLDANTFTFWMSTDPLSNGSGSSVTCTPANYNVATATAPGHGLATGGSVTIAGASPSTFNGTFTVTVISSSVFTYNFPGPATSQPTGTITVTSTNGTTATATAPGHGFVQNDTVTIAGASPAGFDGTFVITVIDANTFTYTMSADPGSSASGVITAQTSRVLAGQNPDTNSAAWTRAYNILPNAATALFIDDLLLVPTAYQPSSTDNYATITGGAYSTVDYVVATNYLDYTHFSFANELRINQGSADEIVDLFAFGGNVVVLKTQSWHLLSNLSGGVSTVTQQTMSTVYGCAGPRAWTVVGSNAYFMSPGYGIVVIRQTDLGTMLSVNVPLTAPIQQTLDALDWTQAAGIRMSAWDNKLYVAAVHRVQGPIILVYDFKASVRMGNNVWESGVMTQGWTPMDTGSALNVLEFFRLTLNGRERHFFLDRTGYVNLLEESDGGDQVAPTSADLVALRQTGAWVDGTVPGPQGLAWKEIDSYALTRSYGNSLDQTRPVEAVFSLMTFNPCYSVNLVFAGAANKVAVTANVTRSNLTYDRPFDAQPWDPTNVDDDWATPYRQDYRVNLLPRYVQQLGPASLNAGYVFLLTPSVPWSSTVWSGDDLDYGAQLLVQYYLPSNPGVILFTGDIALSSGMPQVVQLPSIGWPAGMVGKLTLSSMDPNCSAKVSIGQGLNLGSGFVLDQMQESLDTRRVGWRINKSYQLEFENTQGRIQLVGLRLDSAATRKILGTVN